MPDKQVTKEQFKQFLCSYPQAKREGYNFTESGNIVAHIIHDKNKGDRYFITKAEAKPKTKKPKLKISISERH